MAHFLVLSWPIRVRWLELEPFLHFMFFWFLKMKLGQETPAAGVFVPGRAFLASLLLLEDLPLGIPIPLPCCLGM